MLDLMNMINAPPHHIDDWPLKFNSLGVINNKSQ